MTDKEIRALANARTKVADRVRMFEDAARAMQDARLGIVQAEQELDQLERSIRESRRTEKGTS